MNDKKFNQLLWQFHQNLKQFNHFTDETVKTYISCIMQYERFCRENLQINLLETKQEHLFEFMLDLKQKLSPSRITHFRAALRRFFKMLFLYGEIDHNPALNLLPLRRKEPTRYNYIPAADVLALIEEIDCWQEKETDPSGCRTGLRRQTMVQDKLIILLLWCLGLRSLELRSIKKEDIKIINREKKTALLTVHGKGAKQRALLIMDKLFDQLSEYIKKFHNDQLIFPGKNNKVMHDTTVNRRINKYATAAQIKTHITAHSLRHCFATEMYYANVPLETIKTMLGHENLRETSAYIHVSDNDIRYSLNLLHIGA